MTTHTGRHPARISLTPGPFDTWEVRIEYRDDDSEDRQSGFRCRAEAHGWAQTRLDRHYRLGMPGRLGPEP